MCLDTLTSERKPPTRATHWAWKVFGKGDGDELWGDIISYEVSRETWMHAKGKRIRGDCFSYESGFHAFRSRHGARKWSCVGSDVIVRVKLRGVVAEGLQDGCRVLVAREMFVPSDKRRKVRK